MSIRATIAEVLTKRQNKVPQLENVHRELLELEMQIGTLQQMATAEVPKDAANIAADISSKLNNVQEGLTHLSNSVSNVATRFKRGMINIGVAGSARQGKSTLLQKISGLSDREIPTSSDLPCTGAKSKIYHSEVRANAEVVFFSKQEFLKEIVYAYYERLNLPKPYSLEEFRQSLPAFVAPENSDERNLKSAIYEELKRIHTAFSSFSGYLSKPAETVALEHIRDYVTQHDDNGNIRSNYLAVKTANIYTKFPNHDVTGLCLVDLPGLEAAQGHEKKLVASLEQEVDAVILVKKPSPQGDQWNSDDFKVIDLINDAVREIELYNWLFILLNELTTGENSQIIQRLMAKPPKTYSSNPIILTANCGDASEVDEKVFSVVLKHVEQNLESTDRQYLSALAQQMQSIWDSLNTVLAQAHHSFNPDDAESTMQFVSLFAEFMGELQIGLEELVLEVRREFTFEGFREKIIEVCDNAQQEPPIPTSAELAKKFWKAGGWPAALQPLLNELRAYLTQYLARHLDTYLKGQVDNVLNQVLRRMFPHSLQNLLEQEIEDQSDPRIILQALQQRVDKEQHPQLYDCFEYIINFNFSYHSLFHYRVRKEMHRLNTFNTEAISQLSHGGNEGNVPEISEQVANGLDQFYKETVFEIRKKLNKEMQTDPADAIFALVEEIKDRFVRAKGIEDEWRKFLYPIRGQVWADKFGALAKEMALRSQWQAAINDVLKTAGQVQDDFSRMV
jgi:hypothetical protein